MIARAVTTSAGALSVRSHLMGLARDFLRRPFDLESELEFEYQLNMFIFSSENKSF